MLFYTTIDARHIQTGKTTHIVDGMIFDNPAGLEICQYDGDSAYYLFYCDENWNVITDTWHQTIDDAIKQAEFEYQHSAQTWQKLERMNASTRRNNDELKAKLCRKQGVSLIQVPYWEKGNIGWIFEAVNVLNRPELQLKGTSL